MYVLSELLDGCPNAKIIEVILENYDDELTTMEISRMADVNSEKTKKYLIHLEKKHIVTQIKDNVYKFNKENSISKALVILEHQIVSTGLKKAIKLAEK